MRVKCDCNQFDRSPMQTINYFFCRKIWHKCYSTPDPVRALKCEHADEETDLDLTLPPDGYIDTQYIVD